MFSLCAFLENVTIPLSVKTIGVNMFYKCYQDYLGVTYKGTEADWKKIDIAVNNSVNITRVTVTGSDGKTWNAGF